MTPELRTQVLHQVMDLLEATYVFPEVAAEIRRQLESRLAEGEYDRVDEAAEFCRVVTEHLQAVSHDKHMRLRQPDPNRLAGAAPADAADYQQRRRHQNHGFAKVERLDGNVGYLDLRAFAHPVDGAGETAVAALNFLGNCSALIFDLRQCPGGSPAMVSLLCSYLFDSWPVHLNSFLDRTGAAMFENWTLGYVPGRRLPEAPVYVLTSPATFSAAEEFTYDLQQLKRATVVGEVTGGGANPGGSHPVAGDLELFISDGRACNPVSKDNWEGRGVAPDIAVPADQALHAAYAAALKQVAAHARTQADPGGAWAALAQEAEAALAKLA